MWLDGISYVELANHWLQNSYLPPIDERFARPASEPEHAHVPLMDGTDLRDVFRSEEDRW